MYKRPVITFLLLALGCCQAGSLSDQPGPDEQQQVRAGEAADSAFLDAKALDREADAPAPDETCEEAISRALAQRSLPGAPALERERAAVLAAAKAEPIFFVHSPVHREDEDVPREALHFRAMLDATEYPWDYLRSLLPRIRPRPALARSILLRDGYLFGPTPKLAFALKDLVGADDLFDEERIWIQRGEQTYLARQDGGGYVYAGGRRAGEPVRLLHLDRVGVGSEPPPPLHRDLRSLRHRLHFDRARIVHVTDQEIVANLRYHDLWVPTLLHTEGASVRVACERPDPGTRDRLRVHRQRASQRREALQVVRRAIVQQIEEQLPFDEPRTEVGQQDGKLRRNFRWAYRTGRRHYRFNGDWYAVFGSEGQPLVPQVCVDFLMDTLERASGTWWRPRGEAREREIGRLDLTALLGEEDRRRVSGLLELAEEHPAWLSVYRVPEAQQVELGDKRDLYAYLARSSDVFRPGDMVVIKGAMPGDPTGLAHAHSFFVYEQDPVTGMPIVLAGNAGRPALRTWQFEALRTPERKIVLRLRPSTAWLTDITAGYTGEATIHPVPLLAVGDI